jgi:hypothetical protein
MPKTPVDEDSQPNSPEGEVGARTIRQARTEPETPSRSMHSTAEQELRFGVGLASAAELGAVLSLDPVPNPPRHPPSLISPTWARQTHDVARRPRGSTKN